MNLYSVGWDLARASRRGTMFKQSLCVSSPPPPPGQEDVLDHVAVFKN